jgi:hypothetical protein
MEMTIGVLFKMLEVRVPKLFPTHTVRERLIVERWFVQEGDILQPGGLMISLEAPPGFFEIPTPPDVTVPHRVVQLHVAESGEIHLNDLLITLEPVSANE